MTANLALINDYRDLSLQMEETKESLHALIAQEQKKIRLKQFLKFLADDETLGAGSENASGQTLAELLFYTEYPLRKEFVYDYNKNRYVPSDQKPRIDLAELMTLLLQKSGMTAGCEELMDYVLQGGSVKDFMKSFPSDVY
ncbi:hypothetical protein [Paenibacillus beijingensis]|uniref:Uncharacterized protein n=1 Tax=Paenibacillus beijingensis TaxID=1126833 RepID=A0A0D5NKR3_9BACL|nr:hypothetical protein [Paenibacillus beijingensis]AJY75705.1 hypothetical protein VN24_15530 [Paenibacillus beijingensis]